MEFGTVAHWKFSGTILGMAIRTRRSVLRRNEGHDHVLRIGDDPPRWKWSRMWTGGWCQSGKRRNDTWRKV